MLGQQESASMGALLPTHPVAPKHDVLIILAAAA